MQVEHHLVENPEGFPGVAQLRKLLLCEEVRIIRRIDCLRYSENTTSGWRATTQL